MQYLIRLTSLQTYAEDERLDAAFITHLPNIRYLCGFTGSSAVLTFCRGVWELFTDGRYTEQARKQVKGATVRVDATAPLAHAARSIARKLRNRITAARIAIEGDYMTLAMRERLTSELEKAMPKSKFRMIQTAGTVERLRIKKDREEIEQIRKAVDLASSVFPKALEAIEPGTTENSVAAELEYLARRSGADKMSFDTIVASGIRSALPHARPSMEKVGRGFVVLDYGVILGGYCSDMTRTVCVGRADSAKRDLYAAVLEAQLAGIAAVRSGVEAQQVDAAARTVLRKHKLDKYFTHSLGHGVGIEIHEAPRLAKRETQKLEAGMVVTIEPGVYVPGMGGVRIEDMVLVTPTGSEVLTPTSKELVIR
jgi:Xaa-Pro aminopeptidase